MRQTIHKIEVPPRSLIIITLFLVGAYFLYQLLPIIMLFFVAVLFMVAINPLVNRIETWGVPRPLSISLVYAVLIIIVAVLASLLIPPLILQVAVLAKQINIPPNLVDELKLSSLNLQNLEIIANQINSVPKLLNYIGQAFNLIVIMFTLIVLTFYLLMERPYLHQHLTWLFSRGQDERRAEKFVNRFEAKVGGWVRAQLILMLIVGLLTYLSLVILGVNFALPLAILAGLLEILPNIGPTIAAIPAIIVAYIYGSPPLALAVLFIYTAIQQVENNLIVPLIMRKAIDIHPIITIILLLSGLKLAGFLGAILAIPIYLVVKILASEWFHFKKDLNLSKH